ncbi:MAG: MATE family efflux transporter [Oscillospiraceae bacterium]|nr:MATE family efflux transporter [Oscillospiraceae bacterium]
MKKKTMTEGTPWKHILSFAFPVLIGSLLQQLYNTIDTIIVGNYASEDALSAVGTTGSFSFFFLAVAMGFSSGNGVIVAQHYGANDEKMVRAHASTGIIMLMGMGIIAALAGVFTSVPAFTYLVKVPDSILELTVQYFRVYSIGFVFQFGYNIFSSILRAVGDSAATLYFLLISSVINIGLDFLFVAAFGWGVVGAAAATDIAQLVSFIAAYIYMTKKYPVFRFKLREYTWNKYFALKTIQVGFPIAFQLVIVSLGLTLIQRAVNGFGKVMTASYTVGQRIEMYMNLPCNAFQTTLATYTGQNIGAGKPDRVRTGARQTVFISVALTLIVTVCVWFGADTIGSWFGLSEEAMVYCTDHLRTIALINIVLSSYIPLFGLFQGANHPAVPTCVALCAITTRVIVTYLFRYSDFLGYTIVWWNGIFGFGLGFTITWSYYLSRKWMKNSSIARKA